MDIDKLILLRKNPEAVASISNASKRTGVKFEYLIDTAIKESGLNNNAKALTSSATGTFQFIDQTWLEIIKSKGNKYGLSQFSNHIKRNNDGEYYVKDKKIETQIFNLRKNDKISSLMAGEFTLENSKYLSEKMGRAPTSGEKYIAHLLGKRGAYKLIKLAVYSPNEPANKHFNKAAKSNENIFYHSKSKPKSTREVYFQLVKDHNSNFNNSNIGSNQNELHNQNAFLTKANSKPLQFDFNNLYNSNQINAKQKATSNMANSAKYNSYSLDSQSNKYQWSRQTSNDYNLNQRLNNNLGGIFKQNQAGFDSEAMNMAKNNQINNLEYENQLRESLNNRHFQEMSMDDKNVNDVLRQFLKDKQLEIRQNGINNK